MNKQIRKSELLMPAGSLERLKVAVLYGADAVYLGTPDMSLRTKSKMTLDDVVEGIKFAHDHGVRVYLTLNLFTHNKDLPKLSDYVETIKSVQPDGVIIADPGVFAYVKEHAPDINLHVSTQANVCSTLTVKFWEDQGAELVVLAREVPFVEMEEIRKNCPKIKLEAFVHGAMCMTYSGRCLLSNFMSERGANQGNCANSCRWKYKLHLRLKDGTLKELEITEETSELYEFLLEEGHRPGDLLPIEEDLRGSYILNSKDLCLMPKLDNYLRIGVDSLKVEGRNKSAYYVAVVARTYRQAIDDYYRDPENWNPHKYMRELETSGNRGYTLAFHEGRLKNYAHNFEHTKTLASWEYAGIIREVHDDAFIMEAKNKLESGAVLEFLPPKSTKTILLRLYEFEKAENGTKCSVINAGHKPFIRIPFSAFDHEDPNAIKCALVPLTVVRKEASMSEAEWQRLKLDRVSSKIELAQAPEHIYPERVKVLQKAVDEANESELALERRPKTPRFGVEGCCGKGCNGCLMFWNDPTYEKARKLLAKKKHGEMFDKDMCDRG